MPKPKKLRIADELVSPTPEQMQHGAFTIEKVVDRTESGSLDLKGIAYRRRPMIDILAEQGILSEAEHKALHHYRHHADIVDKSPLKDSIRKLLSRGGGSNDHGPTRAYLNAAYVVNQCEKAVGSLLDIFRAVVVYDKSLSQWVIDNGAWREHCRMKNGVRVCRIEALDYHVKVARVEIKVAAGRVEAKLGE